MTDDKLIDHDVVVVGAGFAGLYALHALRQRHWSVKLMERGHDVGGTWYWNRYPGARCDVASFDYSYSFSEELQQEWSWSEHYASQPEILRYVRHVADRFDLRRDIAFDTTIASARWDEKACTWTVTDESGMETTSSYLVMATGVLSVPLVPQIQGLSDFQGRLLHTSEWPPSGVDFAGRDVVMIGTGSSGVQAAPIVAESASSLRVLQRTANYVMPARNTPIPEVVQREVKATYADRRRRARALSSAYIKTNGTQSALEQPRDVVEAEFERRWAEGGTGILSSFTDLKTDLDANALLADFLARKIHAVVHDRATADTLTPHGYPVGAKRLCVGTDFYETFNRDNVGIHDVARDPIIAIEAGGVRTRGAWFPADDLILATGFDAMTGALARIHVTGRGGASLRDAWDAGPRNYLGLAVHGFPNMFVIGGPGSPSVLANVVTGVEQHSDWVVRCLDFLRDNSFTSIEAEADAEDGWLEHADEIARKTMFYRANSWYLGANVPGKPRIFMPYAGGFPLYEAKCDEVAEAGYKGFQLA